LIVEHSVIAYHSPYSSVRALSLLIYFCYIVFYTMKTASPPLTRASPLMRWGTSLFSTLGCSDRCLVLGRGKTDIGAPVPLRRARSRWGFAGFVYYYRHLHPASTTEGSYHPYPPHPALCLLLRPATIYLPM
jgi:hypothetical protein